MPPTEGGGMEINMCDLLYHFTSLEGFERIIKNGYLAMTDIIKSNDPAEGGLCPGSIGNNIYKADVLRRFRRRNL